MAGTQDEPLNKSLVVQRQAENLPETRIVLYKRSHLIEPKGYFVVEISTLLDELFITAFSVVRSDTYLLKL